MPSRLDTNFPQPTDDNEFELLVRDICALEWGDPHTDRFGRSAQKQYGVDVYGRPVDLSGKYRGAQCKLRKAGKQLTRKEVEGEVAASRLFPHELDGLIIATNAPRDTNVQLMINQISELEIERRNVQVSIWFWDNITERLAAYPELIVKYYPDFYSNFTALPLVERLIDQPLHLVSLRYSAQNDILLLEQYLRLRGIRVTVSTESALLRAFPTQSTISPDGVLCSLDISSLVISDPVLLTFASRVLTCSHQVDTDCPIYVVLPSAAVPDFKSHLNSIGGSIERVQLLSDTVSSRERADIVFKQIFDYGYARRGGPATINISVRTREGRPKHILLDLDWQDRLTTSFFPSPAEWQEDFVPALCAVRNQVLSQSDRTRLQINCQLPLPAAFAVGFFFNLRVARVGVWARMNAVSDFKHQFWLSDGPTANISLEPQWVRPLGNRCRSAILELTTHGSIGGAIEAYLEGSDQAADPWVQIKFEEAGLSRLNVTESDAVAYANQVGHTIRKLNEHGVTDTHLFARIPSSLAVLIGQRLHACGRVHLYWFENPTYRFAFTLH